MREFPAHLHFSSRSFLSLPHTPDPTNRKPKILNETPKYPILPEPSRPPPTMPDLGKALTPPSVLALPPLRRCTSEALVEELKGAMLGWSSQTLLPIPVEALEECDEWGVDGDGTWEAMGSPKAVRCEVVEKKRAFLLPFLCNAPKMVCFICNQKAVWRCTRCTMAAYTKCSPWPDDLIMLSGKSTHAICWRHPKDWHYDTKNEVPTSDLEEAFSRLPLPYVSEEFRIDSLLEEVLETNTKPTPYVHIKRNVYLVKKRRDNEHVGVGCTNCNFLSSCGDDCECRGQSVSCSRGCHCSELCKNRPFRRDKKIKVVKTQFCGWGVEAFEDIQKGDFIIEYIGEVIDDAQCEKRLWDMKYRGDQNFYMCEIRKNFTIDATFKGNISRFLNHSCEPNCKLEKWHVEGETRVGVFASRSIAVGEPLTYDYRFEHFGPMVECRCGASSCQGYIGSKKKVSKEVVSYWGCKRRRTSVLVTK